MTGITRKVPLARPTLGKAEAEAATRAILSGWVTQGPEVEAFEKEFAASVGAEYAVAVSSGTTALHLALLGAGVQPGDEVVTVSYSHIATANAARYCGAVPVFVDIERDNPNMDPDQVGAAITDKTRAVLCAHQIGMPADLAGLRDIAQAHGVALIEDASCAAGTKILMDGEWVTVGAPAGLAAVFSFHPRKLLTTGEGGLITTNDRELAERLALLRNHGASVSGLQKHTGKSVRAEQFTELGYNYRMSDIHAAVGREQIKRLPSMVAERRRLGQRYIDAFQGLEWVEPPFEPAFGRTNWQSFSVKLAAGINRDQVAFELMERGVATRPGIICAHREPVFRNLPCPHSLVQSEDTQDRSLILPLFDGLTDEDQDYVVSSLKDVLEHQ